MHLPSISTLLVPLLALGTVAQYPVSSSSTTTLTSTATQTKTITVSQVVAYVTSTYAAHNSTTAGPTAVGTTSYYSHPSASGGASGSGGVVAPTSIVLGATSSPTPSSTLPSNFLGAASSLNSMYAGTAGVVVMIAAALL